MSLETVRERQQAIESLVASEGWQLFQSAMNQEWGSEAVLERCTQALARIKDATTADEQREFSKLLNARMQMRQMLEWPQRQLDKMKTEVQAERPSQLRRA